jgi:hypothetical protein
MLPIFMPLIYIVMLCISVVILYGIGGMISSINFTGGIDLIAIIIIASYWLIIQPVLIGKVIRKYILDSIFNRYNISFTDTVKYIKILYGILLSIHIALYIYLIICIA